MFAIRRDGHFDLVCGMFLRPERQMSKLTLRFYLISAANSLSHTLIE